MLAQRLSDALDESFWATFRNALLGAGATDREIDSVAAYMVTAEPALLKLEPSTTGKLRFNAERLKTFDGDVTVELSPSPGLDMPTQVVIPRGKTGVDIEVKTDANLTAGRRNINLNTTADVGGFEEEQRGRFEVEIMKKN